MLDAALEISGRTDNYRKSVDKVQASATGTVGLDALAWIYGKAGLPKELRLRAALNVSGSSVEWRANGDVAARGSVNVVGGPNIGFAVRSLPKRIEIEQLTLRDDASDVTLGGSLEGSHFKVAYKGRLAGSSIEHIFVEPLVSLTSCRAISAPTATTNAPMPPRRPAICRGQRSGSRPCFRCR